MATATVTTKGQVTIPAEVRERLGIEAGSKVHFVPHDDGSWGFMVSAGSVSDIRGMFAGDHPVVTIEDMDFVIAAAAAERFTRE